MTFCGIPSTPDSNSDAPNVYIVDAVALQQEALQPIFDLLQSDEHVKIVFDGRMDWSELYHRYHVKITNVLDLQIADIDSRKRRGEDGRRQRNRLSPFLYREDVMSDPVSYVHVHRLNSLASCVREHDILPDTTIDVKDSEYSYCFSC